MKGKIYIMDEILIWMNDKYQGNWMQVYDALNNREKPNMHQVENITDKFEGRKIITLLHPQYPEFLKGYYKPPFIVELKGKKVYYIYGKDLSKNFEIKENAEKEYIANLTKICK